MNENETTGALPTSQALAEASPMSLNDLLSRDPDFGTDAVGRAGWLDQLVKVLREQRERIAKASGAKGGSGASGAGASPKSTKSPKGLNLDVVKTTSSDDLGF